MLSQEDVDVGWCVVKRKSKDGATFGRPTTAITTCPVRTTRPIQRWLHGRCFRCLGLGHIKESCKEAPRCYRYWYLGHPERHCTFQEGNCRPRRQLRRLPLCLRVAARTVKPVASATLAVAPALVAAIPSLMATEARPAPLKLMTKSTGKSMEDITAGDPLLRPASGGEVLSWT